MYELLGGPVRDDVRTHTWIGIEEEDRDGLSERAERVVDEGYDALKFYPTPVDASGLGVTIDGEVFEESFDLPDRDWYSGEPGEHSHLPEW